MFLLVFILILKWSRFYVTEQQDLSLLAKVKNYFDLYAARALGRKWEGSDK